MSKQIDWSRVITVAAKLIKGPKFERERYVMIFFKTHRKSKDQTKFMVFCYMQMYKIFCVLRDESPDLARKAFSLPVWKRIIAIDKKVSRRKKPAS